MPCLNEAETLETCIKKAQKSVKQHSLSAEIIVVDNGSSDGSQVIAEENDAKVVAIKEQGYGAALRGGIVSARGRYIIMGDADDSYDFSDIFPFIERLREGFDLVMGCRFPAGGGKIMPGAMPLKHRFLGNPILSFVGNFFFRSPITDFHCGLRAFTKDAFLRMDLHTTGMEFASEMVIAASLLRLKIAEIPVILYKDGRSRPPHLRSWHDGWRHLRFMLMYCPRWLFLYPGALLWFFGSIAFISLWIKGSIVIGGVGFESNSMLVAGMALLIGFQFVSFYIFTKVFAVMEGFLPRDRIVERFTTIISLELSVIFGTIFLIVGIFLLGRAVLIWQQTGFGALYKGITLNQIIPAITFLLFGVQVILTRFFLSILGLHRK